MNIEKQILFIAIYLINFKYTGKTSFSFKLKNHYIGAMCKGPLE